MSITTCTTRGVGVCIDDLSIDDDKLANVVKKSSIPRIVEIFEEARAYNANRKDRGACKGEWLGKLLTNFDEALEELKAENEALYCYCGDYTAIIAALINEQHDLRLTACRGFTDYRDYIVFEPRYPWSDMTLTERSLTYDTLVDVFVDFLQTIVTEKLSPDIVDYREITNYV